MMDPDWTAFVIGLVTGSMASALFFAGLGLGMHAALRERYTLALLAVSAVVRIAGFLAIGWAVVTYAGPWAFAGYALSFLIARRVATLAARRGASAGEAT